MAFKMRIIHYFLIAIGLLVVWQSGLLNGIGSQKASLQAVSAPDCIVDFRINHLGVGSDGDWISVNSVGYGYESSGTDDIEQAGTPVDMGDWQLYIVNDVNSVLIGYKIYTTSSVDATANDIYDYYSLTDPDAALAILADVPLVGYNAREHHIFGSCSFCGDNVCDFGLGVGSEALEEEPLVIAGSNYTQNPANLCESDCGTVHYCGDTVCDSVEVSNYGFGLYSEICDNGDSIDDSNGTVKECMSDCQACITGCTLDTDCQTGEICDNTGACITGTVSTCGDGVIDTGEVCDTTSFGGATCASKGFANGTLACNTACALDTTGCVPVTTPGDVPIVEEPTFFGKYKWFIIIIGGLAVIGFMMGPKKLKKLMK